MIAPEIALGSQLGRYLLERHLASGGMADVWLATVSGPEGFKKKVVVKTLRRQFTEDPLSIQMFVQEARLAAHIDHPNVVQVFDFGQFDERFFIAMEYVSGANMRQIQRRLRKHNKLVPVALVLVTLSAVCEALSYAHTLEDEDGIPLGIVHRDISPDNIMVTYAGATKVVDFGIAKANSTSVVTEVGVVKGKYAYMSPEQVLGGHVDARSDLYSLGVVAYELLTGRKPYRGKTNFLVMKAVLQGELAPPRDRAPWISERMEQIILRAMQRDPADRFATAAEMGSALDGVLSEFPDVPSRRAISGFVRKLFATPSSVPPPAFGVPQPSPKPAVVSRTSIPPPGADDGEIVVELGGEELISVPPDAIESVPPVALEDAFDSLINDVDGEVDSNGSGVVPEPPTSDVDGAWDRVGEESETFEWELPTPAESGQGLIVLPPSSAGPRVTSTDTEDDLLPGSTGELSDDTPEPSSTLASAVLESSPLGPSNPEETDSREHVRVEALKNEGLHPWDVAASRLVPSSSRSNAPGSSPKEAWDPAGLLGKKHSERDAAPPSSGSKSSLWDEAVRSVRAEDSKPDSQPKQASSRTNADESQKGPDSPSTWDRAVRATRGKSSKTGTVAAGWKISRKTPSEADAAAMAFEEGLACFRRKEYDQALRAWERACELAPEDRRYSINLKKLRERLSGGKS